MSLPADSAWMTSHSEVMDTVPKVFVTTGFHFTKLKRSPRLLRVPRVYLGSAFLRFFSILPFRRISNLGAFNVPRGSIPTRASIKSPIFTRV